MHSTVIFVARIIERIIKVQRTKIFVAGIVNRIIKVQRTNIFVARPSIKINQGAAHRNINQMANTFTQCYFHLVFSPKNRQALIGQTWSNELEMYITGIIQNHKHKLLAINSMPDHIHIFIGYNVNHLIPDLVEEIKTSSNAWIKQKKYSKFKFEWQKGYGAFTYSHSQINQVVKYINRQQDHHSKKTFNEEYLEMLNKNDIKFKDEYLFNFHDDVSNWE